MNANLDQLIARAKQGGDYTLNEIRDYVGPQVDASRAMEITIRVHSSIQDLNPQERICALACALMMELI